MPKKINQIESIRLAAGGTVLEPTTYDIEFEDLAGLRAARSVLLKFGWREINVDPATLSFEEAKAYLRPVEQTGKVLGLGSIVYLLFGEGATRVYAKVVVLSRANGLVSVEVQQVIEQGMNTNCIVRSAPMVNRTDLYIEPE